MLLEWCSVYGCLINQRLDRDEDLDEDRDNDGEGTEDGSGNWAEAACLAARIHGLRDIWV